MDVRAAPYALDRGLDRIVDDDPVAGLPSSQAPLVPSEFGHVAALQRLLALNTLDDALEAAVKPELADRGLLSPADFRAALIDAEEALRAAAPGNPETARQLQRGARVLADMRSLDGLLLQYRHALLLG